MKRLIQGFFRMFGRELRRVDSPTRSFSAGIKHLAGFVSPVTVIDVGVGRGTPELYRHFSSQGYLLVEASPNFSETLEELAKQLNSAVVENVFCGQTSGVQEMRIYRDSHKSSMFEPRRTLDLETVTTVPVATLDSLVAKHDLSPPFVVKIDVEGAELEVVRGAKNTLQRTEAVVAETSILPRFVGAPEFAELVREMSQHGFAVFDILAATNHAGNNCLNQVDVVFVRKDSHFRYPVS